MDSTLKIKILGCGPSSGVPAIGAKGGFWGQCDPKIHKNARLRSSDSYKY